MSGVNERQIGGRLPSHLGGRVALVTGAGHGMGRAHCLELARRGARVAVNGLEPRAAQETAGAVREQGGEAIALPADVSDRRAVEQAVRKLGETWNAIDIVVNNAGNVHSSTGLAETSDHEWRRTFGVHVDGAMYVTRACLPWLERSPAPRIILISSLWGQAGVGHSHAYCSAKGALIAFAKSLAKELGPKGICVNSVAPGGVHTRMVWDTMSAQEIEDEYRSIPLGRYADPEEISYLVAFLASDEAAFVTGQTLPINGGELIGGF